MIAQGELPPAYTQHAVVQGSPSRVWPIAVYMDGVAYTQSDTVVGMWVTNMVSQTRHLVALVRKRLLCRCGCKG
eukprot:12886049-Alexandrium_andersonii.AAC.1